MALFTDTFAGTFDGKKSRLSVPAAYRGLLSRLSAEAVVLRKSNHSPCIEVWPQPDFERMVDRAIADLDPFSSEYALRSRKLVGRASTLTMDAEGRLVVPKQLVEAAGLKDAVAFAGQARFFEIWDSAALEEHDRRLAEQEAA
jgi:MraZ protein